MSHRPLISEQGIAVETESCHAERQEVASKAKLAQELKKIEDIHGRRQETD
jgi:hypothetical protein